MADPELSSKNILLSALSIAFMTLYFYIISPLLLWCCSDGNIRALSRLSCGRCFSSGISLNFLYLHLNLGCQITFPYSKCSRTIVGNSLGKVTVPRNVKVALIKPNKRDASSTALETWAWNFSSSSINTARSFLILVPPNISVSIWYFNFNLNCLEEAFAFGFTET